MKKPNQKTVVVVDDDKKFLEEIGEALSQEGYCVFTFSEGNAAIEAIPKIGPDLVLLDLKLDDVSGFHVADKLKGYLDDEQIPVIAMTGYYTKKEYVLIAKICGIKRCFTKPFDTELLLKEISRVIKEKGKAARDQQADQAKS